MAINNTSEHEIATSTSSAESTLYLGHDGEWWDYSIICSLILAAVMAAVVAVATFGAIRAHKLEAKVSEERAKAVELELEKTKNAAKQVDANLLHEQRLTANERWRLERLERSIFPRSASVNWASLVSELKKHNFKPVNIAVQDSPSEASEFGARLAEALKEVHLLGKYISIGRPRSETLLSGTGVMMLAAKQEDAEGLNDFLWANFRIGGAMTSFAVSLPPEWAAIPRDENCLLVMDNHSEMLPSDGQPGEGLDERGRPVPRP